MSIRNLLQEKIEMQTWSMDKPRAVVRGSFILKLLRVALIALRPLSHPSMQKFAAFAE